MATRYPRRRSKYRVDRTGLGKFGSKAEKARYEYLSLLEKAGEISDLKPHPPFRVEPKGCAKIQYTPDSVYLTKDGEMTAEDVKGAHVTEAASIRMRLFQWAYGDQYKLMISRAVYAYRDKKRVIVGWTMTPFGERKPRRARRKK